MSMYISYAPSIEHTAAENRSAFPDAPQVLDAERPARSRHLAAGLLRRLAALELAFAARLDRRDVRHPATA